MSNDSGAALEGDDYTKKERTARDRLLGMASEAGKQNEGSRKWSVLGLLVARFGLDAVIAHQLGQPAPRDLDSVVGQLAAMSATKEALCAYNAAVIASEGEILSAAYGDSGRGYWQAWLDETVDRKVLARLLAVSTASNAIQFESVKKETLAALLKISDVEPRATIDRLMQNVNTRHLVPQSLRDFLSPPIVEDVVTPVTETTKPVAHVALLDFLMNEADGATAEPTLRGRAESHFKDNSIKDHTWREAFAMVPHGKKMGRGRPKRH